MSLLSPLSFTVHKCRPFANTLATSLVDYLPIGGTATGLLLGCDPRKILYTMYAEENGASSAVSLTLRIAAEIRFYSLRGGTCRSWYTMDEYSNVSAKHPPLHIPTRQLQ
jgi:hypothetical protein